PEGRLSTRIDRLLFAAICVLIGVFYVGSALFVESYPKYTPWASCTDSCPANAFLVVDSEPAIVRNVVIPAREALSIALLIAVAAVRAVRGRRGGVLRRRPLTPLVLTSLFSTLTLAVYYVVRALDGDGDEALIVGNIWALSLPAVAGGFLAGLLRRRARVGDV